MKWTMVTLPEYDAGSGQCTGVEYEAPIRCDTYLYNTAPNPGGGRYYLLNPSDAGYNSLEDIRLNVIDALRFSPFDNNGYIANSGIAAEPIFTEVMRTFMGSGGAWLDFNVNTQYVNEDAPGMFVCAYNELGSGKRATSGFFSPPVPFLGADSINIGSYGTYKSFIYTFDIYAEGLIDTGVYNIDNLYVAPGQGDDDVKLYASATVEIWFDTVLNKYNCQVYLTSYQRNTSYFKAWLENKEVDHVYDSNDPTNNDPNQNNNGGNGDNDNGSDPIGMPDLPGSDMTSAGSIRVYSMTNAQVKSMFDYLHSNNPGDAIMKWWTNPIQGLVSLHYLPYALSLKSGTAESIKICGMDTTVTASAANQFQEINFGYRYAPTNKNCYLDRAPYTRVQIYLPGIGIRDLNTDDIIGKYVFCKYQCDNVSGQCIAFISTATNNDPKNASVKYSFSGSLAAPFPISQTNWGNTYIAAATLAAGALAVGATAAAAGGAAAAGAGAAGAGEAAAAGTEAAAGAGTAANIGAGASSVGNSLAQLAKPSIARSGTISGTTSLFSVKKPYLILEKPNVQDYEEFNKLKGYACGKTFKISELKGYTEVESVHIKGIIATSPELAEIEALLHQGVIV